jgi:hypothetical protein
MTITDTAPAHPAACLGSALALALTLLAPDVARGEPLDSRLAGTWTRRETTYVSAGDSSVLIVTDWRITVAADGRFTYWRKGSHTGVVQFAGRAVQDGDRLRYRTDTGQTGTVRFRLSGSNGLWLDGGLFERQR